MPIGAGPLGTVVIDLSAFDAFLFDLDGVITMTAGLHASAWKKLFDDHLAARAARTGGPVAPFDIVTDYRAYVDGKPRHAGIRDFFASRGLRLPIHYKLSKQPDVLMLFYLFSAGELRSLFQRLGYPFDDQTIPRNINYYYPRSAHDSSLSRVADTWVLARADRPGSWDVFMEALVTDVADIQGGTTPEGIHLGAMAGTVDVLQRCDTGLELRGDVLWLNPRLPKSLPRLRLFVRYRGQSLDIELAGDAVRVNAMHGEAPSIRVAVNGAIHDVAASEAAASR
ncbi:MAG: glycosyl hydrolase family 65 protein [Candidatus Rokuibacteriota bacterium]